MTTAKVTYLNLGSFVDVIRAPGWVNVDILPLAERLPGVAFRQADLRRGIPWANDSVAAIRASHVLEHLTLEEGQRFCRELYRVLEPGGVARIAVPDAQVILPRYLAGQMDTFDSIQPDEYRRAATQGEKLSRLLFSGDYAHRALYDYWMLRDFLGQAGFTMVAQRRPNETCCEVIERDAPDQHVEESLFVEAVK